MGREQGCGLEHRFGFDGAGKPELGIVFVHVMECAYQVIVSEYRMALVGSLPILRVCAVYNLLV